MKGGTQVSATTAVTLAPETNKFDLLLADRGGLYPPPPAIVAGASMCPAPPALLPLKRRLPDCQEELLHQRLSTLTIESTAIGFMDSQQLRGSHAPLSTLLAAPVPSVASEHGRLDRTQLERLMGITYTSHLIFERERDFDSMHLWSMPPPCSPANPFGSIPSAAALGCAEQLRAGELAPQLFIRYVGIVDGVDCGLGLFASAPIASGSFLCEYTGLVQIASPTPERDDYSFGLPVCDPDVRISAQKYGNICRLFNHSDIPNVRLRCAVQEGVIHVFAMATADVPVGAQLTVHYGESYWRAHGRSSSKVPL